MLNQQRRTLFLSVWAIALVIGLGAGTGWPSDADTPAVEARLSSSHAGDWLTTPRQTEGYPASAGASLAGNLLRNPDFEDGFTEREDGAVRVAIGWEPWYLHDRASEYMRRPEWSPEFLWLPSIRVLHGDLGQKVFNSWAIHDAGLFQRVEGVPVGARLEFSIWVQIWTNECDNICLSPLERSQGCRGHINGDYHVAVGIDPTGAAPAGRNRPLPRTIVWSDLRPPAYDRWVRLSVQAVAESSTVTVFTRSRPYVAVKHNDSYWDSADLRVIPVSQAVTPTHAAADLRRVEVAAQPTGTPSTGPTPRPTLTPTPAVPTDPGPEKGCWQAIEDGGFEGGSGLWKLGSNQWAGIATIRARDGRNALMLGEVGGPRGYVAEAWRDVYLPADVNQARLRFWAWRGASETLSIQGSSKGRGGALSEQSVVVETLDGTPLAFAMRPSRTNDTTWQSYELNLVGYRGRTVRVRFRASADAWDTVMLYVDSVSVELCRASGPQSRARQARNIFPNPETNQVGGYGVRLGYLRYSLSQPGFFPFPNECDAGAFEFAQFENFGSPINIGGWTLSDGQGNRYTFPPLVMPKGYQVRVWTGPGPDFLGAGVADLYAHFEREVWGDLRDTVTLRDAQGRVVTQYAYEWED